MHTGPCMAIDVGHNRRAAPAMPPLRDLCGQRWEV